MLSANYCVLTVTSINQKVRQLLENNMDTVWLTGEVSNFSQPASGHWYFTLKDSRAQVRCVFFCYGRQKVTFCPHNGQQVILQATITLYEPRGDYQLLVKKIQLAGEGLLQRQFEQLKKFLESQGLFDDKCKPPLPNPIRCVGVITSASGAALYDIIRVLKRRDPLLPIIIYPTLVQGNEAVVQIIRSLELANLRQECDVLILGRGGGSLEDLWCFNDERVARAIHTSKIPVVSAVGHEIDITISDFVSTVRAPTPSAAAELVSCDIQERRRQLSVHQQRLAMALDYCLVRYEKQFSNISNRLEQQHPQLRLAEQKSSLGYWQSQLQICIRQYIHQRQQYQQIVLQRLLQQSLQYDILQYQEKLQYLYHRLTQFLQQQLSNEREHFVTLCSRLESSNPMSLLMRGFNITQIQTGYVLSSIEQVVPGDLLSTRVQNGWVQSTVVSTKKIS